MPELETRVAAAREERDALMVDMSDAAFWNDQANSRRKLDAFQRASNQVDLVDGIGRALDELRRLCAASDPPPGEAARHYNFLLRELPRVELTTLFTGPHDALGVYLQVRARGRPEAARRWVRELAQMYLAWAQRRGFLASGLGEEWQAGRETPHRGVSTATTATATLAISGYGDFGLLKGEAGLHRLVQGGAGGKDEPPQKINAQVRVLPDLPEGGGPAGAEMQVDVTAPAGDQGGLLLKRLATRVTVTHRPSGRSLSLAGELPPGDLADEAAKLLWTELTLAQAAPAGGESNGKSGDEGGNGLVRTYLRHKQRGVRDHRTGLKLGNLKKVLDGGLDVLLAARLKAA